MPLDHDKVGVFERGLQESGHEEIARGLFYPDRLARFPVALPALAEQGYRRRADERGGFGQVCPPGKPKFTGPAISIIRRINVLQILPLVHNDTSILKRSTSR